MTSINTATQIPLSIDVIGRNGKLAEPWVFFFNHLQTSLPDFGVNFVQDETAETYAPLKISQGPSITRTGTPVQGQLFISTDSGEIFVADGAGNWVLQSPALIGDLLKPAGSSMTTLAEVNATPGIYGSASEIPIITVNSKGLGTEIISVPVIADAGTLSGDTLAANVLHSSLVSVGVLSSLVVSGTATASNLSGINTGDQTIALSGDVTGTGTAGIVSTLANTSVTPGSYTATNLTVDSKGRITAASSGGAGSYVTSIAGTANQVTASASTGAITLSLPSTLVAPGTIAGSNLSGTNTGDQTITLTGDVTGTGTGSFASTLATVNSNVGSFGSSTSIPTITVNGKGLITAASGNVVIAPAGTLTGSTLASGVTASSLTSLGTLGSLTVTGSTTSGTFIPSSSTAPTNGIYLYATNAVGISTNSTGNIFISAAGNLGVGIAPVSGVKVQIKVATNENIGFLDQSSMATVCGLTDAGSSTSLRITGNPLYLCGNGSTEHFRISNTGALGVGGANYGSSGQVLTSNGTAAPSWQGQPVLIQVPCSDETTALTAGTSKITFRAPYAFTLTAVRASVNTAPTGGTLLTVDVNESGTSVLSTKLTFDASEKTTVTAATPAVISDSAIADDAEISIDIDSIGSTVAGAGLKVTLIGTRP